MTARGHTCRMFAAVATCWRHMCEKRASGATWRLASPRVANLPCRRHMAHGLDRPRLLLVHRQRDGLLQLVYGPKAPPERSLLSILRCISVGLTCCVCGDIKANSGFPLAPSTNFRTAFDLRQGALFIFPRRLLVRRAATRWPARGRRSAPDGGSPAAPRIPRCRFRPRIHQDL